MIRLICAHCERTLQVQVNVAGHRIYCPSCRHVNLVPHTTIASADTLHAPQEPATLPPTAVADAAATLPPAPAARESAALPPLAAFTEAAPATLPPGARPSGLPAAAADAGSSPDGYEIVGELGRGGMGVVYKARQSKLRRIVALKMILSGGHAGDADLERFRTEAEAIARLQHPNIVQIHEVGEHGGLPYFSLEFCAGGSLEKKLAGTPLPPRQAAALVEKLARAMQAAHDQQVIHRDLKPANVLLAEDGTPKITDFGLAKKLDEAGKTQTGSIMGTPSYMAPEQAGGKSKELGPACDIYALGAVLYECLTGRPPFRAATPLDTVIQVVSDEPVALTQLNAKVPRDLETICLKCLQKEPAKRYGQALALAEDLRRFQAGEPIAARPIGALGRSWRWCRRRPLVASLLGAVAATLVLGMTVSAFFAVVAWRNAEDANANARAAKAARDEAIAEKNNTAAALTETEKARQQAVADRQLAEQARLQSDKDRQTAQEEKGKAVAAQHQTAKQLLRSKSLLYNMQFQEAYQHFRNYDLLHCRLALDECRWDWRGLEYGYLVKQLAKMVVPLYGHTHGVSSLALAGDGKRLFSGSWDQTIKVWDLETGNETLTLRGHSKEVRSLALSADGKRLFSGSGDKTIKVWDLETGKETLTLRGHTGPVHSLALSPCGKRLYSGSDDQTIKVWDLEAGKETTTLRGHTNQVASLALDVTGKHLISGSYDRTIKVWDLQTGKETSTLRGHSHMVLCLALDMAGKRLFSGSYDGTIKVWDLETGKETSTLRVDSPFVLSLALSPCGKRLFSGSFDVKGKTGEIKVWDLEAGKETLSLRGHTDRVASLVSSADGKRLFSGSHDGTIKVWDLETGKETLTLRGHTNSVLSLALSGDGKRLFSGSHDSTIKMWDLQTGNETNTLRGHSFGVSSLALAADGKRLFSGSHDGTIKVWDVATEQEANPQK